MSSKSYVHLRTCFIPEPTECCSPKHVTCRGWTRRKRWLDCSKQTIFSCEEKSLFNCWAGPIELVSYEDNLFSRDTYFQAFALISLPKHNIFFLSFSPSRGATSIVYRCKQKGTQKPYALKVLKKTVSLFHYIITSLRELWPEEARSPGSKDKRTRELLHAANSFESWLWKCSQMGCVLMETVRLWKQLGLRWNVAVGRSVARKVFRRAGKLALYTSHGFRYICVHTRKACCLKTPKCNTNGGICIRSHQLPIDFQMLGLLQ